MTENHLDFKKGRLYKVTDRTAEKFIEIEVAQVPGQKKEEKAVIETKEEKAQPETKSTTKAPK